MVSAIIYNSRCFNISHRIPSGDAPPSESRTPKGEGGGGNVRFTPHGIQLKGLLRQTPNDVLMHANIPHRQRYLLPDNCTVKKVIINYKLFTHKQLMMTISFKDSVKLLFKKKLL